MASQRRPKEEGPASGTQFGFQQHQALPDIDGHPQFAVQGINPGVRRADFSKEFRPEPIAFRVEPGDLGHEFLPSLLQVGAQSMVIWRDVALQPRCDLIVETRGAILLLEGR